ncbi:MAG: outer membrane beta-barrel family protein, partial [candidate division WOR-3 bacterium]
YFFFIADHEHHFDTTEHKLVGRAYVVGRNGSSRSGNRELDTAGITTNGRHNEEVGPTGWLRAELEYLLPTGEESKFEAGFQSRLERMKVNNRFYWFNTLTDTWDIDLGSSYPYLGTQEIHSLYTTYSWNWQKITIQPGLRGEYGTRIIRILELDSIWQVNRWDYFPSLHLSYALFQNQRIKASYSRRIDRPYYWYLRPLLVWYDQKNVMKGNPLLLPSYVNSWEIGYELPLGANIFSLEAYYRTTKDIFEWVTTKYSESTAVLLLTAANVGRIRSVGVDFSLNLTPVKWLTAFFTGDVADYHEWGALFSQEVDRHAITWSGSLNLTFQFLNTTQVQFTSNLSGPEITATGSSEGLFNADIAIKQTLFNRALSFTLRCSNLLGPGTWRSREQGLGFTSRFSYTGEGRTLSFAVSYNFNNFRLDPKMRVGEGIEQEGTGTIRQR